MVKSLPAMQETGLIPGSGRSPGEGNGYPPQYSCPQKHMDREAWLATVRGCHPPGFSIHGAAKESDATNALFPM